jgi:hypothetical protein
MRVIKEAAKALVAKLGYQTNRHIVVFESDDWGAVRVPDAGALAAFKERFLSFKLDHYQSFDGLEKKNDVSDLSSLLLERSSSFEVSAPVLTLNFATANPDFDRCVPGDAHNARFEFEPIDETYRTYDGDEGVLDFVRLGCGETGLHPQLHGREHLNVTAWLADAATDPVVEYARGLRMVGLDDAFYNGIDALNSGNTLIDVHGYLEDAVAIFERLFGFAPKSFIPPCYVANKECERIAAGLGIETIQSSPKRNVPKGNNSYLKKINVFGHSNVPGQCRLIRNVQFEPSRSMFQGKSVDECVDAAFAEIETAFKRRQPAVICTHRVNYTSRVDESHRAFSLEALDGLLRGLAMRYPDCEFMTSEQLGRLILSGGATVR